MTIPYTDIDPFDAIFLTLIIACVVGQLVETFKGSKR